MGGSWGDGKLIAFIMNKVYNDESSQRHTGAANQLPWGGVKEVADFPKKTRAEQNVISE